MALSEQELQIAEFGKENGKSKEEVLKAIARFRKQQIQGVQTREEPSETTPDTGIEEFPTQPRFRETVEDIQQIGTGIQARARERGTKIRESISKGFSGEQSPVSGGFQAATQAVGFLGDVIGELFKGGVKALSKQETEDKLKEAVAATGKTIVSQEPVQNLIQRWETLQQENPEAARNIEGVLAIGDFVSNITGAGIVAKAGKQALRTGREAFDLTTEQLSRLPKSIKQGFEAVSKRATARSVDKSIQTSIEAVAPDLKRKALVQAYKDSLGTRKGVLSRQLVEPDRVTIEVGESLSGVIKSKDPLKNLNSIDDAFDETEAVLSSTLRADRTPIVKESLTDLLDDVASRTPREIRAIKDSSRIYESVFDFAKQLVNNADPSVNGIREARKAFDRQAKREFPSAYQNGFIDTSKPAGRAIKEARDTINDYMINTADLGGDIRALLQREADLYRAIDNIAPKAAKQHGKTALGRFMQNHPNVKRAAWYAGAGAAGGVGAQVLE